MSWVETFIETLAPVERATWLAELGRFDASAVAATQIAALLAFSRTREFFPVLASSPTRLRLAFSALSTDHAYPGRAEAIVALARAIDRKIPEAEYALPEVGLDGLLERARAVAGHRVPVSGRAGHKGRVGDGVERLLVGAKVAGKIADHAAAEIKSVPVSGDRILERVKLGVVSRGSNPLDKCDRVLFVFVEQRGTDHFVRGHECVEFDHDRWSAMWRDGFLVETAAGKDGKKTRGLYLVPKWFRAAKLWPRAG